MPISAISYKTKPKTQRISTYDIHEHLIGQDTSVDKILPYITTHEGGLSSPDAPVASFFLVGPTGSGKTHTVHCIAEYLHGNPKNFVRIDCAEFQLEHEVAKLVGAPPGYLGHRETAPILTQQKLNSVTSDRSNLSIVLFDEVEKAAPSLNRLLLGVLDRATLKLGDNTNCNFERSLIFFTSNLGTKDINSLTKPFFVLAPPPPTGGISKKKIENLTTGALRRHFSPEFLNRIDEFLVYNHLSQSDLEKILNLQLANFQKHVESRYGPRSPVLIFTDSLKNALLRKCEKFTGGRDLKRILRCHLIQPYAQFLCENDLSPGASHALGWKSGSLHVTETSI